ncbi:xanthine phosphoribosyltransferase [Ligilactobacillus agilis]|uniref:xanthine phosphoribosyltransferase n=1 Tax=Ligilactobacillus agilis TaxID=1601 RepID=UPI00270B2FE2|nr:xanthine phosphoribosyltransferase [Ligilactobacillus agilis]
MKLLEDRIKEDGIVLEGNVLKVNSFLNHQIDPDLMAAIGQEFAKLFKDQGITRILTVESSGIAPAIMVGYALHVPVVFARKKKSSTLNEAVYSAEVFSYTKNVLNTISVDQKFLTASDKVLIIDDFLANGQAVLGLIEICHQAKADIVGAGIVVEKSFQKGADLIKKAGVHLESLARIEAFVDGQVKFVEE